MATTTTPIDREQGLYDALLALVEECSGNLIVAERIATLTVALDLENGRECDGCDRKMDEEVLSVAGFSFSTACDSNGDPDVTMCPVCIAEGAPY